MIKIGSTVAMIQDANIYGEVVAIQQIGDATFVSVLEPAFSECHSFTALIEDVYETAVPEDSADTEIEGDDDLACASELSDIDDIDAELAFYRRMESQQDFYN